MNRLIQTPRWAVCVAAAIIGLSAGSLLVPSTTMAAQVNNLYTAEVAFERQRRDGRARAYRDALNTVLRRLTTADAQAQARATITRPAEFVLGWSEVSAGRLLVSFDGVALTDALRNAGLPVWGSNRPLTLVWLAVEGADGRRELIGANAASNEAKSALDAPEGDVEAIEAPTVDLASQWLTPLQEASSLRGVPVRLPLLDEQDVAAVTSSDIWGGFDDVVLAASRRYGVDSVLIGRAQSDRPDATRWTWWFAGERARFSGDLNRAVGRVAGSLIAQFASSPDASANVRVSIVGLAGQRSFARVSRFLATQSLIEAVRVEAMRNDEILFEVDALASRARLAQILDGDVLEQIDAPLELAQAPFGMRDTPGELVSPVPTADPAIGEGGDTLSGSLLVPGAAGFDDADLYFRLRESDGARQRL